MELPSTHQMRNRDLCALAATASALPCSVVIRALKKSHRLTGRITRRIDRQRGQSASRAMRGDAFDVERVLQRCRKWGVVEH